MGPEEHLKKHAGTDRKRSADTRRRERRRAGFNHRTGRARRFLEEEGRAASDISSRSANSAERAEERATRDESGPPLHTGGTQTGAPPDVLCNSPPTTRKQTWRRLTRARETDELI